MDKCREDFKHWLQTRFRIPIGRPNRDQTWDRLLDEREKWLHIYGVSYVWLVDQWMDGYAGCFVLNPMLTYEVRPADGTPRHFVTRNLLDDEPVRLRPEEVIVSKRSYRLDQP